MSKFLAQRYMTLPRSTLPDVAVVTVDFALEHHFFFFWVMYIVYYVSLVTILSLYLHQ